MEVRCYRRRMIKRFWDIVYNEGVEQMKKNVNEGGIPKMEQMMNGKTKKIIATVLLILGALLSVLVVAKPASSPEWHKKSIESLDEKKATVMELTAAVAATSTIVTMLPGDAATPIAEQISRVTPYFVVVLCALYLEKYLITLTGYLSFTILFPLALVLLAINIHIGRDKLKNLAVKLILFGTAIFVVVPASVKISSLIENTYETSISTTLENAKQSASEVQESAEKLEGEDEEGFFEGLVNKIGGGITNMTTKAKSWLNNFIEAAAVMLVTSCVIPILVLVFLIWIVKVIIGINIKIPQIPMKSRKHSKRTDGETV